MENLVGVNIKEIKSLKETCKAILNIPKWIHDIIKQVLIELLPDNLSSKYLHGRAQNSNESLHNVIWEKFPKNVFVERQTLEIGVYSEVIEFNERCQGSPKVIEYMGLHTDSRLITKSRQRDSVRVNKMVKKYRKKGKKRMKTLKGVKKGYVDKEKELEPKESYIAGRH